MPDDDLTALFPLLTETPESIRARLLISANAGIDPDVPAYADDVPGSWLDDMDGAVSLELDRVYDRMATDVPTAALPQTATGDWLDAWADLVGLLRKAATTASGVESFAGPEGTAIPTGTQVSTTAPDADTDPIVFQTTEPATITGGSVDVPITALNPGSSGDVPANSVTVLGTPIDGVSITNAAAVTSGADEETDDQLSVRVQKKLKSTTGAGNVAYYENIALNKPGVGYVTVKPNTPSLGHVTITISDTNREPASAALVASLQQDLDPSDQAGQGAGLAAPGATVVVNTPSALVFSVTATIEPATGYSLDGSNGTVAIRGDILAAVLAYTVTLGAGDDVVHDKVLAAIVSLPSVDDLSGLTLTPAGGTATTGDLAVADDQVAELDSNLNLS